MYDICSMLTKKQKNLLIFINKKIRSTGISPSYEEMKNSLNLKSKSGIHRLISALEERGFIKRLAHKARALEVLKLPETASANDIYNSFSPSVIKGGLDTENKNKKISQIPVLGKIAAGTPIEAIQNEVSRVVLPEEISKNGEHFGLKVSEKLNASEYKTLLAILLLAVGVIMGIETFVLDKGSSLFAIESVGKIDNKLAEIVLALSTNNPIVYGLISIITVVIIGITFSYVRELIRYIKFDLDKKKYNFFK